MALLATSCGGSTGEPRDTAAAGDVAEVAEVFTEPPDQEPIPSPRRPELLGLDSSPTTTGDREPERPSSAPPLILAFEDVGDPEPQVDADPVDPATPDAAQSDAGDASGARGSMPSDDADEAVLPTEDERDGDEADRVLPAPGPAAPGVSPDYDDPSDLLFNAAGRSVTLFDLGASEATTRGITVDTITVAGITTESLAGAAFRVDVCAGARARFAQANAHGELSREIVFDSCHDDTGRPELNAGLVNRVIRDGAFAAVPMASPAFGSATTFQDERVPYVGYDALPGFCGRSTTLGFGSHGSRGCPVLRARGFVSLAEPVLAAYGAAPDRTLTSAVAYAVERGERGEATAARRAFEAELLDVPTPVFVGELPTAVDPAPRDWQPVAAALMAVGSPTVFVEGDNVAGLPSALRASGFSGEIVLVGALDPLLLADADMRASLAPLTIVTAGLDLATLDTPGRVALESAAASVGFAPDQIGLDFVEGYVAADFLVRAVDATPDPLSAERLANTINEGWWYPGIDGLACGSWWPASHLEPAPCVSIARVDAFEPALVPVLGLVATEPQVRFELDG